MATPTMVTISGTVQVPPGTADATFRLVMEQEDYLFHADGTVIEPTRYSALTNSGGDISIEVPATTDPAWRVSASGSWTYRCYFDPIDNGEQTAPFRVGIPHDMGDLTLNVLIPAGGVAQVALYAPINHTHPGSGAVDSVNGRTGAVTLTKADVNLGNVTNVAQATSSDVSASMTAHLAAGDPHSQYLTTTEGGAAYAALVHSHSKAAITDLTTSSLGITGDVSATGDLTAGDDVFVGDTVIWSPGAGEIRAYKLGPGQLQLDAAISVAGDMSLGGQAALHADATLDDITEPGAPAAGKIKLYSNAGTLYVKKPDNSKFAVGAGGGGGSTPTFVRSRISDGNFNDAAHGSFTIVGPNATPTNLTLSIPAVTGDEVELVVNGMFDNGASTNNFYDACIIVGGSAVRYSSTGTSTPALEGDVSIYPRQSLRFNGTTLIWNLTVAGGDISGGNVTFGLAHKGPGGGSVQANTNYPFRWHATNFG